MLAILAFFLSGVQGASEPATCKNTEAFTELTFGNQRTVLESTHVRFRPHDYYVPASPVVLFPDGRAHVCNASTYPGEFAARVAESVVVVKLVPRFTGVCPVEAWAYLLGKLGARAVLLWNVDPADEVYVYATKSFFDDKFVRIPVRMIPASAAQKMVALRKDARAWAGVRVAMQCGTPPAPPSVKHVQKVPQLLCVRVGGKHKHKHLSGVWRVDFHHFNHRHFWFTDVCGHSKHHLHGHHGHHHHSTHHHNHHHHHHSHKHRRLLTVARSAPAHSHAHSHATPPVPPGCHRYYLYYHAGRNAWVLDSSKTRAPLRPHVSCPAHPAPSPLNCQLWAGEHQERLDVAVTRAHSRARCLSHLHLQDEAERKKQLAAVAELERVDTYFLMTLVAVMLATMAIVLCACFYARRRRAAKAQADALGAKGVKVRRGYVMTDNEHSSTENAEADPELQARLDFAQPANLSVEAKQEEEAVEVDAPEMELAVSPTAEMQVQSPFEAASAPVAEK